MESVTDLPETPSIGKPFPNDTRTKLAQHAASGLSLQVGRYSYGFPTLYYGSGDPKAKLHIGSFCSIGGNCQIYVGIGARHPLDFVSTSPLAMIFGQPSRLDVSRMHEGDLSVTIGSDVWIGIDVVIMAGVTIGHGAVIGARSLVTKNVLPYSIVGGVPAAHIRYRFREEEIVRLLKLSWWEWDDSVIKENLHLFYMRDIYHALAGLEKVSERLRSLN